MKEISGTLEMLGNSTAFPDRVNYSVIKVGDQVVTYVNVDTGLASFLSGCVGEPITIWTEGVTGAGNRLTGLRRENGNVYISKPQAARIATAWILIVVGIILLPVFLIGVFALFPAYKLWKIHSSQTGMVARFPTAIQV